MDATVAIVQRRLTQYRVPLFESVRELLGDAGIQLRVLHGEGTKEELKKNDGGTLNWGERLPTRYFGGGRLCWQPFRPLTSECDLVIVTQENKLLNNLVALADPRRTASLAFWGHGRNMQSRRPGGMLEIFKRWTTNRVDWWFAYTELSAGFVREAGFPGERITVLNNSIDTAELHRLMQMSRREAPHVLLKRFGLGDGPTALYIGSFYPEKRLEFLIDAAERIRRQVPNFQLAIAGDGPERSKVTTAATVRPYIVYVGTVSGVRKAEFLACGSMLLNPGLVGLGILDAFVSGLPLLTTDCGLHSPEIAYLENGVNGLMTPDSIDLYAAAAADLFKNPSKLKQLSDGAVRSAAHYSIDRMAARFCDGIQACLRYGESRERPAR